MFLCSASSFSFLRALIFRVQQFSLPMLTMWWTFVAWASSSQCWSPMLWMLQPWVQQMLDIFLWYLVPSTLLEWISQDMSVIDQTYFLKVLFEGFFQCCDRFSYPVTISILGNMLMAICLLLVGPAPLLNLAPSKNLLFICGALIGFGHSQVMSKINDKREMIKSHMWHNLPKAHFYDNGKVNFRQWCLPSSVPTMLLWGKVMPATWRHTSLWQGNIVSYSSVSFALRHEIHWQEFGQHPSI